MHEDSPSLPNEKIDVCLPAMSASLKLDTSVSFVNQPVKTLQGLALFFVPLILKGLFLLHGKFPFLFSQDLLEQKRIDQSETDLDQMEAQDGHLLILGPIREEFPSASGEDEPIHTVPLFNDIERFLDFLAESLVAEIFAEENSLDDPAQFVESLIRRVLKITACKSPQQCICIRPSRLEG